MRDEVRKYMEAALEKLSPTRAQELARSLVQGQGKDQVSKAAQDLLEWSQRNRERVMEIVQREVRAQLKTFGVASREEVEALRKRVRELERGAGGSGSKRPVVKRAATKKPSAKRSAAKRSSG